tara:strand:+ start:83 stop:652 length:570 start_codon:yes stop_codon:yes gene_type:complete
MASSNTELDVANRALQKLGVKEVTSLVDIKDKRVKAILNCLDSTRDRLLRENPWNFASKRVSISSDASVPVWEFKYNYRLPADFLYLTEILGDPNYLMEGEFIASDNTSPLKIRYVSRMTDTTRFDSSMTEAWASLMAYEMCMRLEGDMALRDRLEREYELSIVRAKKFDGQEDHSQESPEDELIQLRS